MSSTLWRFKKRTPVSLPSSICAYISFRNCVRRVAVKLFFLSPAGHSVGKPSLLNNYTPDHVSGTVTSCSELVILRWVYSWTVCWYTHLCGEGLLLLLSIWQGIYGYDYWGWNRALCRWVLYNTWVCHICNNLKMIWPHLYIVDSKDYDESHMW